jgi:hypothetical protein
MQNNACIRYPSNGPAAFTPKTNISRPCTTFSEFGFTRRAAADPISRIVKGLPQNKIYFLRAGILTAGETRARRISAVICNEASGQKTKRKK